jgi:hypothetical protein
MPQRCRICASPKRKTFETFARADGATVKGVALELGFPVQSGYRHARHHMDGASGVRRSRSVAKAAASASFSAVASDPVATFREAFGYEPLRWQVPYLEETRPVVLLKGRQIGASQSNAALAIDTARSKPNSLTAIISPSLRQSGEIALRCRMGLMAMGEKLVQDSASVLRLDNGSRIISLPGSDRSVRGYPADLLILDESAWVPEPTWVAARATVAATKGRVVVASTPGAPVGWYFELATATPPGWARMVVRSDEVETIDPEFLAREKRELSPAMYAQEYEATFASEASLGRWFADEDFDKHIDPRFTATVVALPGAEEEG